MWKETNLRVNFHASRYHSLISEVKCYQNILPPQVQGENIKKYLFGKDRMIQQVPGTCKISILCLQLHVSLKDELPKRNEGNTPSSSNAMLNKNSSIRCSAEKVSFSSVITIRVQINLVGTRITRWKSQYVYVFLYLTPFFIKTI